MSTTRIIRTAGLWKLGALAGLAALPACAFALAPQGPIKADPKGVSGKQANAAAALRQARSGALAAPASAEAARDYAASLADAIGVGLRREAENWEWDKLLDEAVAGVERCCAPGTGDVCAAALMQESRVLWAAKRKGEAVKAARDSMTIKPTLEAGGLLIQMYDERNEHGPVAGVCEQMKEVIRAEPQDRRLNLLRLCFEEARAGSLEKALGWLTPDEMKEAKEFIGGSEETDRERGLLRRARDESDKVRQRAFDLDRKWKIAIHARCSDRMFVAPELNPFAAGAHLQPLDKGEAWLAVSMGTVIWVFDAKKRPINVEVVDERISRLDVECHDFALH
jgi:hypothetical protein